MVNGSTVDVLELIAKFSQEILHAENVKRILERLCSRKKSCDEMGIVRKFTYLGVRVSAFGGCEVSVTAR